MGHAWPTHRWVVAGRLVLATLVCALVGAAPAAARRPQGQVIVSEPRALNGSANNPTHPEWGEAGSRYVRLAPARYANGISEPVEGPNPRYVSNRVFNAIGVDLFSPRNVSQWVWVWGQFLDHNFELAEGGGEEMPISVDQNDPLESFSDTLGLIPFARDAVAPGSGTGTENPRQLINTVPSYIDGFAVYGGSQSRLEWLRTGPDDGNPEDAGASLMLPGGYLPLAGARGDVAAAPKMTEEGALTPEAAAIGGDVRANENASLDAVTTLFAREHNRIVSELPESLTAEQKFQIARRVVGAEIQYITYTAFLPAVGVQLSRYAGYDPSVDPEISDEFATVGYRAHSMVDGEQEIIVPTGTYSAEQQQALRALGVRVEPVTVGHHQGELLFITQSAAFFNPAMVPGVGLGTLLAGLSETPNYRNDEQIDNALRSVLFEVPGSNERTPAQCFEQPQLSGCFSGIVDLGAIDVQRGRDHGIPSYAQLREALGLGVPGSFDQLTGENTEELPPGRTINTPGILNFTTFTDRKGHVTSPEDSSDRAVSATRVSTLAARLKATYGSVSNLDAFVGMVSEPAVHGSELGPLQYAIWRRQFEALRDGDRFFYENDPTLAAIKRAYHITYKRTLAQLLTLDAEVPKGEVPGNVFFTRAPKLR
jgi:hypothetical protein